jgi:hypothetical protein
LSSRYDLKPGQVVDSYKNLKEVEMLFDDLKNFVDIRPIRQSACIYLCVSTIVEADIRDPLHEEQMYNRALRGDIKI